MKVTTSWALGFASIIILTQNLLAQNFRRIDQIKANGANVTMNLYQSSDNSIVEFRLVNNDNMAYNVIIRTDLDNMKADKPLPYEGVLAAKQTTEFVAFRIERIDSKKGFYFRNLSWNLNVTAYTTTSKHGKAFVEVKHNGVYELPWQKGKTFRIDNAFNGYGGHKDEWAYAADFSMPVGTMVTAAREGQVVAVESSHNNNGGDDPKLADKANYIFIQHSDGSMARYLHFRHNGALVNVGDQVKVGQNIGYSGNTGWSTGPHLHFDVVVPTNDGKLKTIPFKLKMPNGKLVDPKKGLSLKK